MKLAAFTITLAIIFGTANVLAANSNTPTPAPTTISVLIFGAKADGKSDDTAAFQAAIDAAAKAGGIVEAPRGTYYFAGHLNVPRGVTLQGVFKSVPSHPGIRSHDEARPGDDGTTFLITENAGHEDAPAFITLHDNCTLSGVVLYYPQQITDDAPHPYPWAIALRGNNAAVLDVELLNPYNGIDATHAHRHLIRNVCGQPLRRGIRVDAVYDIGRIENVHFNPWWNMKGKVYQWQFTNGEAFIFGRTDWEYVLNTFCYGYKTGYKFVHTKDGECNGNFLGIGADDCNRAILVEQCAPMALLITNGEFTAFNGPDPTMVEVANTNTGVVRFVNSSFWGPCDQIAQLAGTGTTGFSDCTFVQWGGKAGDHAAIQAASGTVLIRGCEFRENKPHITLGDAVKHAVITGNVFTGKAQITNHSKGNIQIGLNSED